MSNSNLNAAPPEGGVFHVKAEVLGADDVRRAIIRIAHEIVERNRGLDGVVLVGLQRGGVWIAHQLAEAIARIDTSASVPVGAVDVSMFRDDIGLRPVVPGSVTEIPVDLDGAVVVLVDDVLFTGRTVRAALDALNEYGRPRVVQLAVLIDRGHRELPIRPDFVGKNLPSSRDEDVRVSADGVVIFERGGREVVKHLLSIDQIGAEGLRQLLDLTDHMAEINRRPVPKVPALRGKTVVSVFFEDSTRTRLSFETAAKRLSADTMNFSVSTSSVNKGESLRDTIETVGAMGVDAFVVRHKSSGVPHQITGWTEASVINAGDGWHEHPTQALLDCYTIRTSLNRVDGFDGLHIAIVGDIKHSRVARSNVWAFAALGARVTLVAPPTLLPPSLDGWPVEVAHHIDDIIEKVDVLYMLRMQRERMSEALLPSLREYTTSFGLTPARAARLQPHALVMHPGPMNRGVEMVIDPSELPGSVITQQVTNGVSVRMAVLFHLLGSGSGLAADS